MFVRLLTALVVSTLTFACGPEAPASQFPIKQLKARASVDFGCPREQVKTNTLDARTKVATGCGQTAAYVFTCHQCPDVDVSIYWAESTYESCGCTWLLDSARRR
jgi:hypothetical protein